MQHNMWNLLKEHGVVHGIAPTSIKTSNPWYLKFLNAFASWLASIFIFAAFLTAFDDLLKNMPAILSISATLLGLAFFCFKNTKKQFIKSLGLAASMVAQVLVMIIIFGMKETESWHPAIKCLTFFAFEIFVIFIMPNFINAALSTIAAIISLSYAFEQAFIPNIAAAIAMFIASLYWRHEFSYSKYMKKMRAIGYGLIFGMIFFAQKSFWGKGFSIISNTSEVLGSSHAWLQWVNLYLNLYLWWLNDLLMIAVILYTMRYALKYYEKPLKSRESISILLLTLLVCILGIKVQGFNIGIILICLGFFICHSFISVMGVLILVSSVSVYYYNLEMTLLDKAISLLILGIVLLSLRWLLCKSKIWVRFIKNNMIEEGASK